MKGKNYSIRNCDLSQIDFFKQAMKDLGVDPT